MYIDPGSTNVWQTGGVEAVLIEDHSSGKAGPFLSANWVHMLYDVAVLKIGHHIKFFQSSGESETCMLSISLITIL